MDTTKTTTWNVDPSHSEIIFKVKHMMISTVSGNFNDFEAHIETDSETFKDAQFTFRAKIESIDTKNKDRDAHLKSEEFFSGDKFPNLSFKSTSFDGNTMIGDMTIRDVTKEVTLEVDFNGIAEDSYGQTKAGFEIRGTINRKEFNLNWNAITEAGNVVVSDKVKLVADLQFIKQQ